jgi:hypothetical protein
MKARATSTGESIQRYQMQFATECIVNENEELLISPSYHLSDATVSAPGITTRRTAITPVWYKCIAAITLSKY